MIGTQHHLKVMVRRIQRTSNWGPEHKDICDRSRSEIDKGRKDDDRRFRAIQDHPVDYFNRWMVEAGGNIEALGEYDYPSSALRHRESRDEDS